MLVDRRLVKDCNFLSFFSFGRAADDELTLPMPKILSEMSFRTSVTGVGVNSFEVGSLLLVSSLRFLSGVQGGVISGTGCFISEPVFSVHHQHRLGLLLD